MSEFSVFGEAVHNAFNTILKKDNGTKNNVFLIDASADELWSHYLSSFPEGTNPIFRERTEHDCSCCRNFVKNLGAVVYMDASGEFNSVWDVQLSDEVYKPVAEAMAAFVRTKGIKSHFIAGEPTYGSKKTTSGGETWNHFYGSVPKIFQRKMLDSDYIGQRKQDVDITRRSFEEITDEAVEIVSDLIAQNNLYRGDEHKATIQKFKDLKKEYNKRPSVRTKEVWLWTNAKPQTRFKNTVIGTLLVDISEGRGLEESVGSFEAKVAPMNYKRPKALVTQKMIDSAKKKVDELGIEDSLSRRYATREDLSVNDVLFVDGTVKPKLLGGAFDNLKPSKKAAPELKEVVNISIKDFIKDVVPKADQLEVFVKNAHLVNFVSLVAPVHADAPNILKWSNNFSWSYDGEVTDSIRERVKKAGGKVDGDIRVSLSWHNGDDLDLSVQKGRDKIYFANKRDFGGQLDVDMNAGSASNKIDPVENIFWNNQRDIKRGEYQIFVHNFNQRSSANVGFEVEVEVMGQIYNFNHPQTLPDNARVEVGRIVVDAAGKITVTGMKSGGSKGEKWNVQTEVWTPVDVLVRSPNFWDGQKVGNEHVFFILAGCTNPEGTRGFYNEFLNDSLMEHRKVFELLASSLKVPYNENQLSGIGFSTTKREEILVRVKGSINRVLNVQF